MDIGRKPKPRSFLFSFFSLEQIRITNDSFDLHEGTGSGYVPISTFVVKFSSNKLSSDAE
jgi:hypothetical protein